MKAILKTNRAPGFEYREIPLPKPGPGDVLVKIRATAICGSDLKMFHWVSWCENVVKNLPFIPGHECAGEVVEVGEEVGEIKIGDKVAAETHISCGACWQCLHNRSHTCEKMELFGHTVNGSFAEYAVIPERATRRIPDSISFEEGALLEPMGIPLRAVEKGEVKGDAIIVLGCGPIGQFSIAFSKIMGAELIIGIDINERRLQIAKKMGATHTINPKKEANILEEKIKFLTRNYGGGAGSVIEASGNTQASRWAYKFLRVGGKFIFLGQSDKPFTLSPSNDIVFKEIEIIGLFGRKIWDTWEKTEKILASGKIDIKPVVTHRFSLADFETAFEIATSGEGCKVLLIPA